MILCSSYIVSPKGKVISYDLFDMFVANYLNNFNIFHCMELPLVMFQNELPIGCSCLMQMNVACCMENTSHT